MFAGLRYRYPQFRKALFQVKLGYFVSWAAGGAVNEAENHMRVFEHVVAQEEHAKRAQYLDDMADQGKFLK